MKTMKSCELFKTNTIWSSFVINPPESENNLKLDETESFYLLV